MSTFAESGTVVQKRGKKQRSIKPEIGTKSNGQSGNIHGEREMGRGHEMVRTEGEDSQKQSKSTEA